MIVQRTFVFFLVVAASISATTIKGPPIASQRNLQQLARLGDEVKLLCPMEGNPQPIIEWRKGEHMVDYQMIRYRTNKKSLKIKDVDKTDSGRFTCKGINGFGKEEIQIDLIIIDPDDFPGLPDGELPQVTPPTLTPETLTSRDRLEKKPGDTLRLSCGALGKPEPRITWYKNNHELLENVRQRQGKSVLLIRGLMVRDTGTYSCVAENMVGESRKDFVLTIEDEEQPDFSHNPMNRTVREGETATFDCRVRSSALPHIKWLKKLEASDTGYNISEVISVRQDKYKLMQSSRNIPLSVEGEFLSQLILRDVESNHAGMYVCFVTSTMGGFNYRPAFLTVIPRTQSLVTESPLVLILVICLSLVVLCLLAGIITCVVRRRTKEPINPPEAAEVRHSLMPPPSDTSTYPYSGKSEQPLPPPPTPNQWPHLYTTSCTSSSHYEGPTYEVPHPHGGKTPAPSIRYGYSGGGSGYGGVVPGYPQSVVSAHSHHYNPCKGYCPDRPTV